MTEREHELEELRASIVDDPAQRSKLIAGLGDALAARDAEVAGERKEIVDAADSGDDQSRGGLLAALVAGVSRRKVTSCAARPRASALTRPRRCGKVALRSSIVSTP